MFMLQTATQIDAGLLEFMGLLPTFSRIEGRNWRVNLESGVLALCQFGAT